MGNVLQKDDRDVWNVSGGSALSGLLNLDGAVEDLALEDDPADVDDLGDGSHAADLRPLPEGTYRLTAFGAGRIEGVTDLFAVLGDDTG